MENDIADSFLRLVKIMDELREQCPWDKKQTIYTLRSMTIEETYELADAISNNNWQDIKEELGDLMLHILFYSRIAKEENQFQLKQVLEGICEKLITRHPHIYGDVQVRDEEEVKRNWEKIKLREGKKSALSGVPVALPALVKASRIQEKAKQVGFEWHDVKDVWNKVEEEMHELQQAFNEGDKEHMEEEFGDLIFSLINYARFLKIDAEGALEQTNKKFIQRFQQMENIAANKGKLLNDMSLEEMDAIWNEVKKQKINS